MDKLRPVSLALVVGIDVYLPRDAFLRYVVRFGPRNFTFSLKHTHPVLLTRHESQNKRYAIKEKKGRPRFLQNEMLRQITILAYPSPSSSGIGVSGLGRGG